MLEGTEDVVVRMNRIGNPASLLANIPAAMHKPCDLLNPSLFGIVGSAYSGIS